MGCRRLVYGGLGLILGWLSAGPAPAQVPQNRPPARLAPLPMVGELPFEALHPAVRGQVQMVVERATLTTSGPVETFTCKPATYHWLVEHPDQAVRLWRSLGAKCTDIQDRGGGRFGWTDGEGSDIHWDTVLRTPRLRVWYAEGRVKPGMLIPTVSVQAVVVLHHETGADRHGHPAMRHRIDLMVHTDSRAMALAARLLGASAPRVAEQYVGQMEMFFGALAWYLDQHPERASRLLEGPPRPVPYGASPPAEGAPVPSPAG